MHIDGTISLGNILTVATLLGVFLRAGMQWGKLNRTLETLISSIEAVKTQQSKHEEDDTKHFDALRAQVLDLMKGLERLFGISEGKSQIFRQQQRTE